MPVNCVRLTTSQPCISLHTMKGKWTFLGFVFCGLLVAVGCQKSEPRMVEIGTYDLLLDYDNVNGTHIADVYSESMEILYDVNLAGDELVEKMDTVDGHIVHIFGIRHLSRLAIIRFLRNVLPFIQNPSQWIFLVEGGEAESPVLPEIHFFTGVAHELGIPVLDPIVSPLGDDVIHRLLRGTPPMVTVKDVHFAVFENVFPDSTAIDSLSERGRERYVSIITSYSVLPSDSVDALFTEFDTNFLRKPERLEPSRKVFARIRGDMIDTSNVLSLARVSTQIETIMDYEYIFVCVGAYHVPVFEKLDSLHGSFYQIHVTEGE